MKLRDLIKKIESMGCTMIRHGGKHDWYCQPATGEVRPVPRHKEVKENTARKIIKDLSPK